MRFGRRIRRISCQSHTRGACRVRGDLEVPPLRLSVRWHWLATRSSCEGWSPSAGARRSDDQWRRFRRRFWRRGGPGFAQGDPDPEDLLHGDIQREPDEAMSGISAPVKRDCFLLQNARQNCYIQIMKEYHFLALLSRHHLTEWMRSLCEGSSESGPQIGLLSSFILWHFVNLAVRASGRPLSASK